MSERYRLLYCTAYHIDPAAFGPPGWPQATSRTGPLSDDIAPAISHLAAALASIRDTLRTDAKACQARADACAAAAAHRRRHRRPRLSA